MKVSLDEANKALDDLINERKTREDIASWALSLQNAEDDDNLDYEPSFEEDRIWKIITYLMGVDLKDQDGSYLHSMANFIDFKNEIASK